ncbi:MAG TPA: hypothetical protein VLB76_11700 [Thermoanaerobaculia bacterium]|nr:hypothetical protein [Thermoanaerobaculia bacterium]
MHVLAVHYAPGAGEAMAASLAEALDKTPYETRARLSDPEGGPAVVARYGEIEPAWACAGRLRANGISPILLTEEDVETDPRRFLVRGFELNEQGIAATSRRGETAEIAARDIALLLRGVRIDEQTELKTTEQRKFSASRALLTQGLMMTKKVRTTEKVTTSSREEFLHLYAVGRPPLVFRSGGLDYRSFGNALQPSVQANFTHLIEEMRRTFPAAPYNERLANRQSRQRILGPGLTDNHLDIAVSLLSHLLLSSPPSR